MDTTAPSLMVVDVAPPLWSQGAVIKFNVGYDPLLLTENAALTDAVMFVAVDAAGAESEQDGDSARR